MSSKASRFITSLFDIYLDKPEQLPPTTQGRLKKEGALKKFNPEKEMKNIAKNGGSDLF